MKKIRYTRRSLKTLSLFPLILASFFLLPTSNFSLLTSTWAEEDLSQFDPSRYPEEKFLKIFPSKGKRLVDTRLILEGRGFQDLMWSTDGRRLAFSGENHRGLWVLPLDKKEKPIRFSYQTGVGRQYRFSRDGRFIAYAYRDGTGDLWHLRVWNVPEMEEVLRGECFKSLLAIAWSKSFILEVVYIEGYEVKVKQYEFSRKMKGVPLAKAQMWGTVAYTDRKGKLWKIWADGSRRLNLFPSGDFLFNPVLSPNLRVVSVNCVDGHAYLVGLATGHVLDLGPGQNPSWGWGVERVVFERVKRYGGKVVSSDIVLADMEEMKSYNLTAPSDEDERYPTLSPDKNQVIYVGGKGIYRGIIQEVASSK